MNDYLRITTSMAVRYAYENNHVFFGVVFTTRLIVNGEARYDLIIVDSGIAKEFFKTFLTQCLAFNLDFAARSGQVSTEVV